jgi:hypothetical protein
MWRTRPLMDVAAAWGRQTARERWARAYGVPFNEETDPAITSYVRRTRTLCYKTDAACALRFPVVT